ncbi:MAG TPA: GNAT family N-acetyltransferase [Ktedonobacteraceae bacterium]|nr:GNAT family N-acetyltransferase [Ktedonobacteraceae bacterium]
MQLTIRRAIFPQNYPAIARVLTAENPDWPTTPEELAREDALRDPKFHWAVFVAEDTSLPENQLIAMASVGHDAWAHREGKFKMNIRVLPDMQGRGVGSRLYQVIFHHLEPLAPRELQTEVWAAHERAVRFVTDRGFVEIWRRIDLSLDVADFNFTRFAGLEEHVKASGMEIKTYAELEHDPDRLVKLYELDRALWQDVPFGEVVTDRSLALFEQEEILDPKFIPDACFIAIHGQAFIGYANLTSQGVYYDAEMTGVLRPFRSKGVATLLKLSTIRYAQAHGNREIWTINDSVNEPMLALNARLGFHYRGAMIRFVKQI